MTSELDNAGLEVLQDALVRLDAIYDPEDDALYALRDRIRAYLSASHQPAQRHNFDRVAGICRNCGQHAAKVGGQPCTPVQPAEAEGLEDAEARVMQQFRYGNLTPLGVANALRRAGFNMSTAVDKANALPEDARITALQAERDAALEINRLAFGSEEHLLTWQALKQRAETAEADVERLTKERDAQYDENVSRIAAEGQAILRATTAESSLASARQQIEQLKKELANGN